ncbi:MAG: hypothetical protein CMJ48_02925 [Planctomycetaceae bacterium]|nr:hypothetical protein [Planctomycetaceae bacterium]
MTNGRLASRRALLSNLDHSPGEARRSRAVDSMDGLQQKALELLSSEASHKALRLSEESPATRESYGRNRYGQSTLLARRLIEAGTRMVTISWAPDANATWDTHSGNFQKLKTTLLPQFDAACASLLTDLDERGMLERTLVAVLGDFGRTPKINGNNAGRDHWNYCYSLMLFGGGFKQGLIHGSSNKIGAYPERSPMIPADVIATLYHLLGIDHEQLLYDRLDRTHALVPAGNVAADLIA